MRTNESTARALLVSNNEVADSPETEGLSQFGRR
jgi:hypothetical protein